MAELRETRERPWTAASLLAFDAEQRLEARHLAGQLGLFGRVDHRAHVLVGARGFFGHASEGWAADQDATARQLVHDLAAPPLFRSLDPAHVATGAMAGGTEGQPHAFCRPAQNVGAGAHGPADQDRLPDGPERSEEHTSEL